MTYSLTWLPTVLQAAGLKIVLTAKWETHGRGEMGEVFGVMCHHTSTPKSVIGNFPTLNGLIDGVTQKSGKFIPGPLAHLGLARSGTYYVIAAGRASHAGPGEWNKLTDGNQNFIGIEAENAGTPDDFPWPAVQMSAYRRGVAAILRHIGRTVDFCCGHKEYRHPLGFKDDPSFDMNQFRADVKAILDRPTLSVGMTDPLVVEIRRKLQVTPPSDHFDAATETAVQALQARNKLTADGIIGWNTWGALDNIP